MLSRGEMFSGLGFQVTDAGGKVLQFSNLRKARLCVV